MTTARERPSHEYLAALYEATRAIAEQLSLDRTLATVLEATRQLFAADRAAVFHFDEAGTYVCLASFGLSAGFIDAFSRLGATGPVARRMRAARSAVLVEDAVALAPPNDPVRAIIAAEGYQSVLALPMFRGDVLSGTLVIYHDRRRRYSGEELQVAEALVGQAAIAIDNARLHELAELRAREAQALYEASQQIMSSLDINATLDSILDSIIRLCDADLSGVLLVDDDGAALRCVAARGPQARLILGVSLRLGQGLSGLAAQTGQVVNSPDIEHDARWVRRTNGDLADIRSALSVPARDRERVIAVLTAHSRHLAHFTPARERLLVVLADQAALAILHAREVTGRRRAEESQRFLSEASSLLAASLDYEQTLQSIAHLAVPYIADSCVVDVIEEDRPRRIAVAHVDPARAELMRELNRRYPQTSAGKGGVSTVLRTGRPTLYPDLTDEILRSIARDDEHLRLLRSLEQTTYMSVPLAARGRVFGAITLSSTRADRRYGPSDIALAEDLARRAALAVDNARLYREVTAREQQLQELVGRLLVAQEEERRRIAYDVHDGLAQIATSAHQHLQAFALRHRPRSPRAREGLARAVELAQTTVREARRVIADLRPTTLDDFGLAAALRLQAEQLHAEGWQVTYDEVLEGDRLPAALETALFRVAQEALTNVRKHARTTQVRIGLVRNRQTVRLEVHDWGCGFDPNGIGPAARAGEHVGLAGMRERITLLGGHFHLESQLGIGTRLIAEVPLSTRLQKA